MQSWEPRAPDAAVIEPLFEAARAVRERAYAAYSGFRVGAALRDETGAIHVGCNVENAAYPVGTCAEAGAISAMIAAGGRRVVAIVVLGDGAQLVTPCGACRQRIREFAEPDTPIVHRRSSRHPREDDARRASAPRLRAGVSP